MVQFCHCYFAKESKDEGCQGWGKDSYERNSIWRDVLLDFKRVAIFPDFFLCGVVDGGVVRDPAFTEHGEGAEG